MEIETRAGVGIEQGYRVLVPLTRSILLRPPGAGGALIWSRPKGVLVKEGAARRFLGVPDRTRQIQWAIIGAGLTAALLIRWTFGRARRRRTRR